MSSLKTIFKELSLGSPQDFLNDIEKLRMSNGINYLDALMYYIENYNIEPEAMAAIVRKIPSLKSGLKDDCRGLNLLVKQPVSACNDVFEIVDG